MPIPKTFSAPAPATYRPSVEDCLRDGVWLMMYSDDLHRAYYAYDKNNYAKGFSITSGHPHSGPDGFDVPQLVVQVSVEGGTVNPQTGSSSERLIDITVSHFEPLSEEMVKVNVAAFTRTAEALLSRTEVILAKGTIFAEGMETNRAHVIDPYYSPLLEDGTYDPEGPPRTLNGIPPDVRRLVPRPLPRRLPRNAADYDAILQARDIAIIYSLRARYTVDITNREDLTLGGYAHG